MTVLDQSSGGSRGRQTQINIRDSSVRTGGGCNANHGSGADHVGGGQYKP